MERSASDGCYEGDAALGPKARRSDLDNGVDQIQRSGNAYIGSGPAHFLESVPGQLLILDRCDRTLADSQRLDRPHRVRECKKTKDERY